MYAVNTLVLVHAVVGSGAGGAPPPHGDAGQNARLAELPAGTYPLLTTAARSSLGRAPNARFEFSLDALLAGIRPAMAPISAATR